MIAVDTSALIAILFREAEAAEFAGLIQANGRALVGAPTALEFRMVARRQANAAVEAEAVELLRTASIEVIAWDEIHADAAYRAFERFGKPHARAKLNFGDCLAYAVARIAACPLLFKGDDFSSTDLMPIANRTR